MSNQYILILNQNQRITTYRCEHINYLIKDCIGQLPLTIRNNQLNYHPVESEIK